MSGIKTWRGAAVMVALCSVTAVMAQSLYSEQTFRPLTADHKAFRVGDVLTIQVIENAAAIANADTGSRRSNGISADFMVTNPKPRSSGSIGLNVGGDFDGGGRTERAGKLLAQLTVSVRDVLPNGDLVVGGEQQLTINEEKQRIAVSGRVRPQDVSDGNVVLSTRIADADITYVGDGTLAERQRPAWWRRFLDAVGF